MKALITGGAGFIGSHLADRLVELGHEVAILDDLSTGTLDNLAGLNDKPGFSFTAGSVTDEALVNDLVDGADIVFHLAAAVGVRLIVERPTLTIETNIRGAEVVLRAAAATGAKTFLASTSEVYGKGIEVPFREDSDLLFGPTTGTRWSYACSKAIDEYLALAYAREQNLPVVIARLFNTVGPRQRGRYGMVLPTFVRQGLSGDDITVYGDGEQTRCFSDVGEVVSCFIALAEAPQATGRVINVGSNREVSINALAELVRQKTGARSRIRHISYADAFNDDFEDLSRRVPDLRRLQEAIGFHPSRSLEEIVTDVVAHQSAQRDRQAATLTP